ncbi:MAG: hypothetical protein J1D77_04375 [Muribaculaceae bacterium]|nr:hypothetical protein [Muribaculaceae bacterium]
MGLKKLPPIEKVYEAWTALADDRVNMHEGYADVSSSDGEKAYVVRFADNRYTSDDNATYWQGYPGYPVLAVMMLQGKLPYDEKEAQLWKNINWTQLNKQYKNNYAKAVEAVAHDRGINLSEATEKVTRVIETLQQLPIEIKRKL